jgi:hypothetical protein
LFFASWKLELEEIEEVPEISVLWYDKSSTFILGWWWWTVEVTWGVSSMLNVKTVFRNRLIDSKFLGSCFFANKSRSLKIFTLAPQSREG